MGWATYHFNANGGTGGETRTLYGETILHVDYYSLYLWHNVKSTSISTSISSIQSIPTHSSATKVFAGYYDGNTQVVTASGMLNTFTVSSGTFESTAYARWDSICPTATISKNSGTGGTSELYYNASDSKWYVDYPFATEFSDSHPITIPTKECYRFLGCYSANNTTSTKYINADGTPTAAFLALAPSNDITIYARWELVSYKITINSSNGIYAYKTFYQSVTADADGKYRYYTDSACAESSLITSIPVPTYECYAWGGLRSTSATTGVLYANADGSFTDAFKNLSAATRTIWGNFWTQVSYKFTLSGSGWTFNPAAYYTNKASGGVYADWLCETIALDYVDIPVRVGYRFLGYKVSTTEVVSYTGQISDTLKQYKAAKTLNVQGRKKTRTVTLDDDGGSGGSGTIYTDATDSCFFNANSATIEWVSVPTKSGYDFKGYYNGDTCIADAEGRLTYSSLSADTTFTARWQRSDSIVSVNAGDGGGGTSTFYYRGENGLFYADYAFTQQITSVTLPSLDYHSTDGLYLGDIQVVNASGVISESFVPAQSYVEISARYTRTMRVVHLGGGSSSLSSIFRSVNGTTWYSDYGMTTAITTVPIPIGGDVFGGYTHGGTLVINASGAILVEAIVDEDYTAVAVWIPITYKVKPSAVGGLVYDGTSRNGVVFDSSLTYSGTVSATNAGNYSATFSLPPSTSSVVYRWTDYTTDNITVSWTISALSVSDSSVTFDSIPNQVWTGSEIRPSVTMRFDGSAETENVDFTVAYSNNIAVGTATATVSGIGNFGGTRDLQFSIVEPPPGITYISKPSSVSGLVYTSSAQIGTSYDSRVITSGTLSAANAGTYTATFNLPPNTSTDEYRWSDDSTGTVSLTWSIAPRPISDSSVTFAAIPDQTYDGTAKRPAVTMYYAGSTRVVNTDYTAEYANNVAIGTALVMLGGIGNFGGSKNLNFNIVAPGPKTVTFNACGGTSSESTRTVNYGSQVGTLPTATRTGYTFDGWFTQSSGGDHVYETNVITSDVTFYAHWSTVIYQITYVLDGGDNNPQNPETYTIEDAVTLLPPSRYDYAFLGWSPDGGVIPVGSTGAKTFTASWTSAHVYHVRFDANGGTVSETSRDVLEQTAIGVLPTPTRYGHQFNGWFNQASGGTQITSEYIPTDDIILYAHWTANTYTLRFDARGGTASFYSKTVTYGQQIGTLPTASAGGQRFEEWRINDIGITAETVYTIAGSTTAVVHWATGFGGVEDYFRLGSANLIPESSDSGESRPRVIAYNATSEAAATDDGPAWMNPRVTYRVVRQTNLSVTLGQAFVAGYMITSVEVVTAIGKPPMVTVSGVANEGVNAVKTYPVAIPISPRHRPQNLMSAVSGGGQLQQLTLRVSCDPVVVAENNRPVASDVVHGRIEVSAVTGAYNAESAPSPNNGFVSVGTALQRSGVGYKFWNINARKELT